MALRGRAAKAGGRRRHGSSSAIDDARFSGVRDRSTPGAGLQVGWTIAGAVAGYLWWQSHRTEGNMMEPVEVVLLVGLGALLGSIVGWIIE